MGLAERARIKNLDSGSSGRGDRDREACIKADGAGISANQICSGRSESPVLLDQIRGLESGVRCFDSK